MYIYIYYLIYHISYTIDIPYLNHLNQPFLNLNKVKGFSHGDPIPGRGVGGAAAHPGPQHRGGRSCGEQVWPLGLRGAAG